MLHSFVLSFLQIDRNTHRMEGKRVQRDYLGWRDVTSIARNPSHWLPRPRARAAHAFLASMDTGLSGRHARRLAAIQLCRYGRESLSIIWMRATVASGWRSDSAR